MRVLEFFGRVARRIPWRWVLGLTALIMLAGGMAVAFFLPTWMDVLEHRLYVVKPGVLYRSSYMSPRCMKAVIQRYKLKTVVNVRVDVKFAMKGVTEEKWMASHGLHYLYLPSHELIDESDIRQFLEVVTNPEYQPVLVHCHQGRSRTGVFVAAYRICVDGWTARAALEEMREYGGARIACELNQPLLQRLEGRDWRQLSFAKPPADGKDPNGKD